MKSFLGKKILVVTAHPDDESFAAAGTIRENRKKGGRTWVICATAGERGMSHLPKPVSPNELKRIRRNELRRAARAAGVHKLFILNFPDGGVKNHKSALFKKVLRVAKTYKPDIVLSFGEDGLSGHHDHIAAGAAAGRAAKKMGLPFVEFAFSPEFMERAEAAKAVLKARRKFGKYKKEIKHKLANFRVKIDAVKKRRVLINHKSQLDKKNGRYVLPRFLRRRAFAYEHFFINNNTLTFLSL